MTCAIRPRFQSKRSLDDSVIVDCLSIARTRHASFLAGIHGTSPTIDKHSRFLTTNSCSDPSILDVKDIGYQTEEVMGALRGSAAADLRQNATEQKLHNSLQFIDASRNGTNTKTQSDGYSLTQNLHNAILQQYTTPPPPNNYLSSNTDAGGRQVQDLDSHNVMLPSLPILSTYHTSLTSLLDVGESSCSSLDPYDLSSAALSRALDIGPMERLYTSMAKMGHDWSKDGDEFNERLYSSAPVHFRRGTFQLDPSSTSKLPPLPTFDDDKKSSSSSLRHHRSHKSDSAVEENRRHRRHDRQSGERRRRSRSSRRNNSNSLEENQIVVSQQQEQQSSHHRRKHSRRRNKTQSS